jgi:hypothetical protein
MHAHHTHHRGVSGSEISIAMFLMNMHANMTMPGDATAVADHAMSPWSQRHTTMSNISFVTATVTKYLRGGGYEYECVRWVMGMRKGATLLCDACSAGVGVWCGMVVEIEWHGDAAIERAVGEENRRGEHSTSRTTRRCA